MIDLKRTKSYCCEDFSLIENYEKAVNDKSQTWHCHHRLETHTSDGIRRDVDITKKELKELGTYLHRPASELIFLTATEHILLHQNGERNNFYGKHHTEETKKKISEAKKGKGAGEDNPFYGKHHTEEARRKVSEANKGRTHTVSAEARKKISEAMKKRWSKVKNT